MTEDNPLVGKKTVGTCGLQVIASADDNLALWLGPNERFVVLMYNTRPVIISHDAPGVYDIAGADFADAGYPVAVIGIDEANTKDFQALPPQIIGKILNKIKAAIDNGTYELKPMTFNFKNGEDKLETFKFDATAINRPKLVH